MTTQEIKDQVQRAFDEHWGRLLALLTRQLRSLDVAEESLADAFELALKTWARDGVPDRPDAWLLTAARRRGLDRLRRAASLARKLPLLIVETEDSRDTADAADTAVEAVLGEEIPDERLRLIFTCCHPALPMESRVALTLRMVGGLTTPEIARAFLIPEPTMAARITRAKKKIAKAGIPYRVPSADDLPERLSGVLTVLYLVFTEGHAATSGSALVRANLCDEAIRLLRVVADLLPSESEPLALLALLLLQHSRRDARVSESGELVLLPDQDRTLWHRAEIEEGLLLLRRAAGSGSPSSYVLQAAIAAEHATAERAEDTDWRRIALLYERLEQVTGSPVVRLNRAVAVAECESPEAALDLLNGLEESLERFHLLHVARADLLARLGKRDEAEQEYARALELATNETERAFLSRKLAELL